MIRVNFCEFSPFSHKFTDKFTKVTFRRPKGRTPLSRPPSFEKLRGPAFSSLQRALARASKTCFIYSRKRQEPHSIDLNWLTFDNRSDLISKHCVMDTIETDNCEPDSTQSEHYESDGEIFEEIDQNEPLSLPSNVNSSRDQSLSFSSQISIDSHPSFRKNPILNTVFIKDQRESVCLMCDQRVKTVEASRLVGHVKKCEAMLESQRREIIDAVESSLIRNTLDGREDRKLNELWASFMIENNVSMKSVATRSFKQFMNVAVKSWKHADRRTFSSHYIPALSRNVRDRMMNSIQLRGDHSISVEFDHWSDINGRLILGIVFTFVGGERYLRSLIDVSLEGHSAVKTVPNILQVLEDVPSSSLNSIISDSASACKLTRELIVENREYRHLIQHRCIAHLLNRIGNLFGEAEHIKESFAWASKVTSYISSSPRLMAIIKKIGKRRPKRACSVRWYSTVNMIESLIEIKNTIIHCTHISKDRAKLAWMENEIHWDSLIRAVEILRPLADSIAISEKKTSSLGEAVLSVMMFVRTLFSKDWSEPLIVEGIASTLKYFGPKKLGDEEFGLLLAAYVLDRRSKCDFITEDGLDLVFSTITRIASVSGCSFDSINTELVAEFTDFCAQRGIFAKSQSVLQSSIDWWSQISAGSTLRLVGYRIARLHASSANIERTFSTLKWVQGCRRTNLSIETLMHMTRIKIFEDFEQESELISHDVIHHADVTDSGIQNNVHECDMESHNINNHHVPEVMSDEVRELYSTFKKYVDFSIVNQKSTRANMDDITPNITGEQMELIKKRCRETRILAKESQSPVQSVNVQSC